MNSARTSQGRILTPKGYGAIGLKAATGNQQSLL
jgi:Holliday junction DNA helicase RuvB